MTRVTIVETHDGFYWDGTDGGWAAAWRELNPEDCAMGDPGVIWRYGGARSVKPGWLIADPILRNVSDKVQEVL